VIHFSVELCCIEMGLNVGRASVGSVLPHYNIKVYAMFHNVNTHRLRFCSTGLLSE